MEKSFEGSVENKHHQTVSRVLLLFALLLVAAFGGNAAGNDVISGYNSLIFRTYSDRTFEGIDIRREDDNNHYTLYNALTIREIKLHQSSGLRIFGSGSGWLRMDLGDKTFDSRTKADLSFGSIQIDQGKPENGFIRLGRLYNYQGVFPERFDGGEIFFSGYKGLELNVYGGVRPLRHTFEGGHNWLGGGRAGYRFSRRHTLGISWLLERTEGQWADQKMSGDWFFSLCRWLYLSGYLGYDLVSRKIYEVNATLQVHIKSTWDLRLEYDNIIPGLLIPKSSIFSVYSLAEEESASLQLIYHPGERWVFSVDMAFIDYENEGGRGGPNNFFTKMNALNGGYQWRFGGGVSFRQNPRDTLSARFEKMVEANFGYTATDLIRTDFDFRNYDPSNPSPEEEGFAFGRLENGFASLSFTHWHQWSRKFSHALTVYYYTYDHPLFLHRNGDDSFSTNLTLSYKINPQWGIHLGGRYLGSLADEEEMQSYARLDRFF